MTRHYQQVKLNKIELLVIFLNLVSIILVLLNY